MSDSPLPQPSGSPQPIPPAAGSRLSLYLRELRRLHRDGVERTSSHELGTALGVTDAVVRRDLAYLGHLGRRGVGYSVVGLTDKIRQLMGIDRTWPVLLVGAGNLGTALLRYRGFSEQGFRVVAAIDVSPERVGQRIGDIAIHSLADLERVVSDHQVALAILSIPASDAPAVAQRLADAGVAGILNFAPITLRLRGSACIANVDLASELQQLAFAIARGESP